MGEIEVGICYTSPLLTICYPLPQKVPMLVKDCMTRHPIMATPETLAAEAQRLMSENHIRHLPVVGDGKKLVGLVTRNSFAIKPDMLSSLNVWEISRRLSNLTVRQVMLKREDIHTIMADRTAERAARLMTEHKIGCLPVVEQGDVVLGILSETDILRALQEMLGFPIGGVRVTMRVPDVPGEVARLLNFVALQKWNLMGIGTFPTRRMSGFYDVVIKLKDVRLDDVQTTLATLPGQTLVDIRDIV